jgi:hypothetical protein
MFRKILLLAALAFSCSNLLARGTYLEPEQFLSETFTTGVPEPAVIWLTGERKDMISRLLGHRYSSLRVRYWRLHQRSAWILEEIGKDLPITVGLVVNQGRLESIQVLIFRESRGEEIRHTFFTDQFTDARLNNDNTLDRHIDGISGATLSVRAMKKLAALALFLDSELKAENVAPPP